MGKARILFLSYVNRSGSTYLLRTLGSSDKMCACPEAEILMKLLLLNPDSELTGKTLEKLNYALKNDIKLRFWGLSEISKNIIAKRITNLQCFEYLLNRYKEKNKPDARIIIYKAEYIVSLFNKLPLNQYKWIGLVRDPRAIFYSQYNTINPYTKKPFATNPVRFSLHWKRFIEKVLEYKVNSSFLLVFYEDLIIKPNAVCDDISSFIGINNCFNDYNNSSSKNFSVIPPEQKNIHKNSVKQAIPDLTNSWEDMIEPEHLHSIQKIVAPLFIKMRPYKIIPEKTGSSFTRYFTFQAHILFEFLRAIGNKVIFKIRRINSICLLW